MIFHKFKHFIKVTTSVCQFANPIPLPAPDICKCLKKHASISSLIFNNYLLNYRCDPNHVMSIKLNNKMIHPNVANNA